MIIREYGDYDGLGLAERVRRGEVPIQDLVDSALRSMSCPGAGHSMAQRDVSLLPL